MSLGGVRIGRFVCKKTWNASLLRAVRSASGICHCTRIGKFRACKSSSKSEPFDAYTFCTGLTNTFFCSSNKSFRPSRRRALKAQCQSGALVFLYCCAGTKGCVFQQLRSCGKNFTHRTAPQLQAAVSCIFLTQLDVLAERIVELVVEAAVSAARKLRAAVSCHSQAAQCEREL